MSDIPELFKTAPAEVKRYFGAKRSLPTFDWRDIAPEEHGFSWTVAKSAGFDILEDIRSAVNDAIVNRMPFDQFAKQLTPILQQKGWWGKKLAVDPIDNLPKLVQLGSLRRLRTIYWANIRTAHAAGEWERTQRNKAFLPFLVYTLSVAENRRIEHEGWVGTVLPVDHPWWETHYPPNGWGCKCGVRQISRAEALRLGWSEKQEDPDAAMRPWLNKRTGQSVMVPAGIDPGWANNPGKSRGRNISEYLYGKIENLTENRQRIAVEDIAGSALLKAMAEGHMPKGTFLPVTQIPAYVQNANDAKTKLVRLSQDSVAHILNDDPSRMLSVEDFRQAISVVSKPEAVVKRGKALAFMGVVNGRWWRTVVKPAAAGLEWWLVSFHQKNDKDALSFIRAARNKNNIID